MQLYRETGQYLERTSEWVERIGLEEIQKAVVHDTANRQALVERIEFALQQVEDPWKKIINDEDSRKNLFEVVTPSIV
ncbi:Nitrite reductase [NAD(P)H] [compost metagenome]